MEVIKSLFDFILHIDQHLTHFISEYGTLTYFILFAIVFIETGLVVMPFLPGDSLLFAAGAIAATNPESLNIWLVIPLLIVAALLGDNLNYFVGKYLGDRIKQRERLLFLKREHLVKTEEFYAKYGAQTVIIARFIPIVRTVAPFVAGAGKMPYQVYIRYCILGALLWVIGVSLLGYSLGNSEFVKKNFELVIFGIIFISILPPIVAFIRAKLKKKPSGN
jgi:membrane-associated protein